MDEFASTSSSGLLKNWYDNSGSPMQAALKKKRLKLAQTKGMDVKEAEDDENTDGQ